MVDVQNLSVITQDGYKLLHQISLHLEVGEVVGLTGQSGAGKSTLLKALLGTLSRGCSISSGEIFVDDIALGTLSLKKHRCLCGTTLGFIPQNPMTAFDPGIKMEKQIVETLHLKMGMSRQQAIDQAKELLVDLGFSQPKRVLNSFPGQLSGGMLQRSAAALLLVMSPKYILADEPTSALDSENRTLLLKLLAQQKERAGILFISHDIAALSQQCDRVYVMECGQLTETGTMEELLSNPTCEWTKEYVTADRSVSKEGWTWKD